MRRIAPILIVAAGHFIVTRWLFEYSGGQMRFAILSGDPENFTGFAIFMGVLFFALPSTALAGLFSQLGASGEIWDLLSLVGGSLIWSGLVVGFWHVFLRPSDQHKRRTRRPGDGWFARVFDRRRVADPEWLSSGAPPAFARHEHEGVPPARSWLRVESGAILAAAIYLYFGQGFGWIPFLLLFLAPDLSFLGYLGGSRFGAICYNLAHSYATGLGLIALGATTMPALLPFALIVVAHIATDRLIGYGLKSPHGFGYTHLGPVGTPVRADSSAIASEAASAEDASPESSA